jgi:hypothetical protein
MSGMPMYVPDNYIPQYFMVNGMSGNQLSDPSGHLYCLANDKVYMRMANIGYYGLRYIFPSSLAARTVASDGRPLPSEMISDTVEILPGERFETFLQTGTDQLYPFTVEHFNLNTQVVESTQTMYLHISALSVEEESQIIAYPNPTDGIFYLTDGVELEFELLESSGKLLESGNGSFVDLSEYSPGIYYVRIQNRILLVVRN